MNAHDYLASSTHVDFQIHKASNGTGKAARLVVEQMQNFCTLYKSKPRYGPESCEDCIGIMNHLRPIEHYFESIDQSFVESLENFGPPMKTKAARESIVRDAASLGDDRANQNESDEYDKDIERLETDLYGYRTKLANYLSEQPLDLDNGVIYSTDLGLAIEKPVNGASLKAIWNIEI